jgi:hypothetical protein
VIWATKNLEFQEDTNTAQKDAKVYLKKSLIKFARFNLCA